MGRGRPRIELDKKTFEGLCAIFCTLEEIATVFDCSEDTVENWCKREYKQNFSEVYKKKSARGKTSLRRYAFKLAEKNTAMCIFLLKNYLGLSDHVEIHDTEALEKLDEVLAGFKEAAYADTAITETE